MEAVLDPVRAVDPALYDELQPLLRLEATKLAQRVDAAESWDELRLVQADADALFSESLGFLGGAMALQAGLDEGRCRIANVLVATLRRDARLPGPWCRSPRSASTSTRCPT